MSHGLPLVPGFIARFIEKWAQKRLPESGHQATLTRQRIYILPTRHGIVFSIILLFILVGSINYENSSGFMLTFLLTGIGFLAMIHTHQNLNHLSLSSMATKPVFSGQIASFPVQLSSASDKQHFNIQFQSGHSEPTGASLINGQSESIVNIPRKSAKRGFLSLGRIRVSSEFPLGLFHAWSWLELDTQCLVYPAPETQPPAFNFSTNQGNGKATELRGNDEFAGIRDYQKGDSSSLLAWKAIARSGKLQSKLFYAEAGDDIWLRWSDIAANTNTEQRLSILCRWILECNNKGINYGLEIPGNKIPPSSGLHHQNKTLKALALYGQQTT